MALNFSLEVTYPEPEGTSSGMLAIGAMLASTVLTLSYGAMIRSVGDVWANNVFTCILVIGTLLHFFMKFSLKRKQAHDSAWEFTEDDGAPQLN